MFNDLPRELPTQAASPSGADGWKLHMKLLSLSSLKCDEKAAA